MSLALWLIVAGVVFIVICAIMSKIGGLMVTNTMNDSFDGFANRNPFRTVQKVSKLVLVASIIRIFAWLALIAGVVLEVIDILRSNGIII